MLQMLYIYTGLQSLLILEAESNWESKTKLIEILANLQQLEAVSSFKPLIRKNRYTYIIYIFKICIIFPLFLIHLNAKLQLHKFHLISFLMIIALAWHSSFHKCLLMIF